MENISLYPGKFSSYAIGNSGNQTFSSSVRSSKASNPSEYTAPAYLLGTFVPTTAIEFSFEKSTSGL